MHSVPFVLAAVLCMFFVLCAVCFVWSESYVLCAESVYVVVATSVPCALYVQHVLGTVCVLCCTSVVCPVCVRVPCALCTVLLVSAFFPLLQCYNVSQLLNDVVMKTLRHDNSIQLSGD